MIQTPAAVVVEAAEAIAVFAEAIEEVSSLDLADMVLSTAVVLEEQQEVIVDAMDTGGNSRCY
jgi:hypothetical protein